MVPLMGRNNARIELGLIDFFDHRVGMEINSVEMGGMLWEQ